MRPRRSRGSFSTSSTRCRRTGAICSTPSMNRTAKRPARYTDLLAGIADKGHAEEREQYVAANGSVFLAGNLVQPENIEKILNSLSDYGVTAEQYDAFGFSDYAKVKDIARTAVVNYRANLEYRLANLKEGETVESVRCCSGVSEVDL